jgi:hypothetical protein
MDARRSLGAQDGKLFSPVDQRRYTWSQQPDSRSTGDGRAADPIRKIAGGEFEMPDSRAIFVSHFVLPG